MRVIVIGGGLLGLSTAYCLQRDGHDVTVVERRGGPALETSCANGSMLTPSMSDPWNAPGVAGELLRWLGREDAPLLLRGRRLPSLLGWGLRFLRNSAEPRFRRNMQRNLRLAKYSLELMPAMRAELGVDYDHAATGTMKVFREAEAFRQARRNAEWLLGEGVPSQLLDRAATLRREPALADIAAQIVGAIYYPDDETGDARRYCDGLAGAIAAGGGQLLFETTVTRLERDDRRVAALQSSAGRLAGDVYVLAAGSYSVALARPLGLRLPIEPVKGYSITVSMHGWTPSPRTAIVDDALHAAVVPLGGRLRVAGTAEFAGYDLSLRERRIANLLRLLGEIYPAGHRRIDPSDVQPWAGLRPMSPDGAPILGRTAFDNLYLNTGHGHLGWTMAAGSARAVADLIDGRPPQIDLHDLGLARF